MKNKKRLKLYIPSMVLGLSDAVVSITGTIIGMAFAVSNTGYIALAGLLVGLSASFSMAASEFLSVREEADGRSPILGAAYTGVTFFTVSFLLVFPFLFLSSTTQAAIATAVVAILVLYSYSWAISKIKGGSVFSRFGIMFGVTASVMIASAIFSTLVADITGIEI